MNESKIPQVKVHSVIRHIARRVANDDMEYISRLMAESGKFQSIATSRTMDLVRNLNTGAGECVIAIYLVVWGIYGQYPACCTTAVTQKQFERVQQRNISMFRFLDKEDDSGLFSEIVHDDHERLHHGELMMYVSHCFQSWPALAQMDINDYCTSLIGMKTVIECFGEIARNAGDETRKTGG